MYDNIARSAAEHIRRQGEHQRTLRVLCLCLSALLSITIICGTACICRTTR